MSLLQNKYFLQDLYLFSTLSNVFLTYMTISISKPMKKRELAHLYGNIMLQIVVVVVVMIKN